jgi:hypothetical protein
VKHLSLMRPKGLDHASMVYRPPLNVKR